MPARYGVPGHPVLDEPSAWRIRPEPRSPGPGPTAPGVPPFVMAATVLHLRLPQAPWTWLAFAASVALAVGVAFAWGFLVQLSAFWILDVRGPSQIGWLCAQFFAGTIVPVFLFPDGLERLARSLPFVSMVQLPAEVFLGKHAGLDLMRVYGQQLAWLVVLLAAGRAVLTRAVRRVVVHGG